MYFAFVLCRTSLEHVYCCCIRY